MDVFFDGFTWRIRHGGKIVDAAFDSQEDAWEWADEFIDDQVTGSPNWLVNPIKYEGGQS